MTVQTLPGVQLVQAQVQSEAELAPLVAQCDAVVNLVAILQGQAADFERVHVDLPRTLGALCARHGVKRVVHVSALGVSAQAPSMYLRSKARGEAVLREAVPSTTILRPSIIFGAGDRFLNLFASLQALAPFMPLGGAGAQMQPVWVKDVAQALLRGLRDPATAGQTYECAGPEVMSLGDLVRLAGRLSGHPRWVIPLPTPLAWLQAAAMECLPGEPLMSRDNVASLKVPNVATGLLPGLDALGIRPAGVEGVAASYLAPRQGLRRFEPWRHHHR
jgi:NADH dehydrogenase